MGFRMYITAYTADGKAKDAFCMGKCYGYNDVNDGYMRGYKFIMNRPEYKAISDDISHDLSDYEIIDMIFDAGGSIDMSLNFDELCQFIDLYITDHNIVRTVKITDDDILKINKYCENCSRFDVTWY